MMRVLLLCVVAAVVSSCSRPAKPTPTPDMKLLLGDEWFRARAAYLGITEEQARARDAALPEDAPPDGIWDSQTGPQAALIFAAQCAGCHGPEGSLEGVPVTDPAPRKLGTMGMRMGFLFGRDKMRAGLYQKISNGGKPPAKPSPMPKFQGALAREQIWALVRYIESL
ncbi:MAG: c-type cytochrome [Myxococcota bacterium]